MTRPALSLAAVSLAVALPVLAADPKDRGVWWEQTTEMEMAGAPFAMPPQTSKVCAPAGSWDAPPTQPAQGEECRVTDLKRSGNRMTWKVVCQGDARMTAEGEMVHSGDTFTGTTTVHSAQGDMKMKMRGRKLGGECDAGESRRMAEAARRNAEQAGRDMEAMQAQIAASSCDAAVESMSLAMLSGPGASCRDPRAKDRFCTRLETPEGLGQLDRPGNEKALREAAEWCRKDVAALRRGTCEKALAAEDLQVLGERCPDQARAVATRECAGRKYTAVSPKYQQFCYAHAAELLATENVGQQPARRAPGAAPASQTDAKGDAKQEAVQQGKKVLKGLFGR